ncbi:MAG: protein kinase [Planctomycetaceae bacterium]|nr:protein kinase [Planctomycetaceae bacterium]
MSLTPAELWQKITSYSIALPDQCRQWANDIARTQGAAAALQTDQIVIYLREQNLLTEYQLAQLTDAAEPLLKIGPWRIEDRVPHAPFSSWFVGNDVARSRKRWLFVVNDSLLQQSDVRQAGPSLEWNKINSAMKLTDGFNFEPLEKQGTQLLLIAQPIEGELFQLQATSPYNIAQWILQLARSLQELHQNRMIHGHIRPDRLWLDSQGKVTLLRDPLVPPNPAATTDAWSPLDCQLEPAGRVHYMAPELSVPGQMWTTSADVYSLGCLWYWLITGSAPFQSFPLNQVAVQHAVSQLYVSENDVGGSRLAECFKFCVAKNPASRFGQAGALAAALEVALSKTEKTATVVTPKAPKLEAKADKPKAEPVKGEVTKANALKSEAPKVESPKVETPKVETPQNDSLKVEPKRSEAAKPTAASTPSLKVEPPKPEPPKVEPPKAESLKADAPKPATAKPTPAQPVVTPPTTVPPQASPPAVPASVKSVPAQTDATKPAPLKPAPPKPDQSKPAQPNPAQAKPEAPASETKKPEIKKPEINKPESQKPEVTKPEVTRTEAPKGDVAIETKAQPAVAKEPIATEPIAKEPVAKEQPSSTVPQPVANVTPSPKTESTEPQLPKPEPSQPKAATPPVAPAPVAPAPVIPAAVVKAPVVAAPPSAAPETKQAEPVVPAPKTETIAAPPVAPTTVAAAVTAPTEAPKKKSGKKKSTGSSGKKKKSSKTRPAWVMPALAAGSLLFMAIVFVLLTQFSGNNNQPAPQPPPIANNDPTAPVDSTEPGDTGTGTKPVARDAVHDKFTVVSDDKTLPWAPPTSGDPFSLDMLPPEAQVWMYWKASKFSQDPQGQQLMSLLEADIAPGTEFLISRSGTTLDNLNDVLIAFYPGKEGKPEIAIRFTLTSEQTLSSLKSKWGNVQDAKSGKATIYTNDRGEAYFASLEPPTSDQKIKSFTVGPQKRIEELVALDGGIPPLRRQLEQLHRRTDASADLTILFAPGFLFTDGRQILANSVPALRDPLAQVLATDMQGGLLTTTMKNNWYAELRLVGNSDQDASRIANDLTKRFTNLPDEIESRLIANSFDASWGKLSLRYPQMLRELLKHLRVNVEDGQAIANFYLPKVAAPNVLVASWLAAHSDSNKTLVANKDDQPTDQPILTPDQFLDRPIKLSFDQESLEIALQSIAESTNDGLPANQPKLTMELDYESMEKDGITQNQQIRQFAHNGVPLRNVLTDLVKRANPTPGIQDTTSAEMKFVWILVDEADKPGGKKLLLTTRAYVADKKLTLSKEFAMP